jgi:endonuclease/exonuclease/phosphatase family metal-dependent hydrolase
MKIATYNIWNDNSTNDIRFDQLINEINSVDADIIGLQEVTEDFYSNHLLTKTNYESCEFRQYTDDEEGLAILSRYPIKSCFFLNTSEEFSYSAALNVIFELGESSFSLTNVHLPWDSIKTQEEQIVVMDRYIHMQKEQADYFIMLGDFNGGFNSSIHRYLNGEQTINGNESNPYWDELSSAYAILNDLPLRPTLDFVNNPRWGGKNTFYIPSVVDRIYILDNWAEKTLRNVRIFGTDISPENNLSASDHYGVVAEVDFGKGK